MNLQKSKDNENENSEKLNEDENRGVRTLFKFPESSCFQENSLFGINRSNNDDTGWLKPIDSFPAKSVFAGNVKPFFVQADTLFISTKPSYNSSTLFTDQSDNSDTNDGSDSDSEIFQNDTNNERCELGERIRKAAESRTLINISRSSDANNFQKDDGSVCEYKEENDQAICTDFAALLRDNDVQPDGFGDELEIDNSDDDPNDLLANFESKNVEVYNERSNADRAENVFNILHEAERQIQADSSYCLCVEVNGPDIESEGLLLSEDGSWHFESEPFHKDEENLSLAHEISVVHESDENVLQTVQSVINDCLIKVSSENDDRLTKAADDHTSNKWNEATSQSNTAVMIANESRCEPSLTIREQIKPGCLRTKRSYKCIDFNDVCAQDNEIFSFINSETDYVNCVLCTQIPDEFLNIRKLYCMFSQNAKLVKIVMCKFSQCVLVVCKSVEDAEKLIHDPQCSELFSLSLLSQNDVSFDFHFETMNSKRATDGREFSSRSSNFDMDSEALETRLKSGVYLDNHQRVEALEMRDELWRRSGCSKSASCLDFCPEKERYNRHRVVPFENELYVKQYTRASADQIVSLHFDLRPPSVLLQTLKYLLDIVDRYPFQHDLYNFVSDRLHAIRKDLVQQGALNSNTAVLCLETCVRFHVYSALRFCELPANVFDPVLNENNLRNSLSSLLLCYETLSKNGTASDNESEFIAISLMLSFKKRSLSGIKYFRDCLLDKPLVKFALEVHEAVITNNFLKFWSLFHSAQPCLACLMHRIINIVRLEALEAFINFGRNASSEYIVAVLGCSSQELPEELKRYNVDITDEKLVLKSKLTLPPLLRCKRVEELFETKPLSTMLSGIEIRRDEISAKDCIMNSFDEKGAFVGTLPPRTDQRNPTSLRKELIFGTSPSNDEPSSITQAEIKKSPVVENEISPKLMFEPSKSPMSFKSVTKFSVAEERPAKKDDEKYNLPAFFNEVTSIKTGASLFGNKSDSAFKLSLISSTPEIKPINPPINVELKTQMADRFLSDLINDHVNKCCKEVSKELLSECLVSYLYSHLTNEEIDKQIKSEVYEQFILSHVKKQCAQQLIIKALQMCIRSYIVQNFLETFFVRWKENTVRALIHKFMHVPPKFDMEPFLNRPILIFNSHKTNNACAEILQTPSTLIDIQEFIQSVMAKGDYVKQLDDGVYECFVQVIDSRIPRNHEQCVSFGFDRVSIHLKFSLVSNIFDVVIQDDTILPHVMVSSLQTDKEFSCPFLQISPDEDLVLMTSYAIKQFCVLLPKEPYELPVLQLINMTDCHFGNVSKTNRMNVLFNAIESCLNETSKFKVISESRNVFASQGSPQFRQTLRSALNTVYNDGVEPSGVRFMNISLDCLKLWSFCTETELFRFIQNEIIQSDSILTGAFVPCSLKRKRFDSDLARVIKRSKEIQTENRRWKRPIFINEPPVEANKLEQSVTELKRSLDIVQEKSLELEKLLSENTFL